MLIVLFTFILIIIGVALLNKDRVEGVPLLIMGIIMLTICFMGIGCENIFATKKINQNKIRYESLEKRLEIIDSDYEDVSKSDVIKDIAEWNEEACDYHYWSDNPFTNWFYSKKIARSYKYIEYDY